MLTAKIGNNDINCYDGKYSKEELKEIIRTNYKMIENKLSISNSIITELEDKDMKIDPVELFKTFLLEFRNTQTDEQMELPITIDEEEKQMLKSRYGRMINAYIEILIERNLPESFFYSELWRYITDSNVFYDIKGSIIALYMCVLDKRLPYYELDKSKAVKMDQETYMMYLNIIGDDVLAKMEYILNGDWTQKTEQASMVLDLLEKYDDTTTKTVFLSRIISHYTSELHKMKRMIMQYLIE